MPVVSSHTPGTFCWVELATPDAEASKTFYSRLLGWTWTDNPMGDSMVYSMMQKDGNFVCGLFQIHEQMIAEGFPPHWACYIATDDVEVATARVTEAGGSVINGPFDVFTAGRMSVVADPTGATFGIWQPKERVGAGLIGEPGSLGWNELNTTDLAAATGFYGSVFGWTLNSQPMEQEEGNYHFFTLEENGVGGMIQIQPDWGEVPPHWSTYFCVEDVDASFQKALELGAEAVVPVMQESNVRFAFLKDPQGIHVGIVQFIP